MDRMRSGELAMFFGTSANVKILQDEGIDTTFLPFFGQDGQQWLMTTPYFQVALNRELNRTAHAATRRYRCSMSCSPRKHRTTSFMTDRTS